MSTVDADMSMMRNRFVEHIGKDGKILDAGCGSGRDCRKFLELGYGAEAFDASGKMCRIASEYIGKEVRQLRFEELDYEAEFDGIWACASLLHVSQENLPAVMKRLKKALKPGGVLYASFKYGEGESEKSGRTFTNMTEETLDKLFRDADFDICESIISNDVRPGRDNEKWINAIGVSRTFRPIRRKKNELSTEEAKTLLKNVRIGVLSVNGDDGYPYAVPVNFLYSEEENRIWFHGAKAGHKAESLEKNDKVCFTVFGDETVKGEFWAPFVKSAVVFGRCRQIRDPERALVTLRQFAGKYYPDQNLIEEEIAASAKAVRMFEIEIEHLSGKEVQEK